MYVEIPKNEDLRISDIFMFLSKLKLEYDFEYLINSSSLNQLFLKFTEDETEQNSEDTETPSNCLPRCLFINDDDAQE